MVTISESKKRPFGPYGSSQFRYALTYVCVTFAVLLFLNFYSAKSSKELFYQGKQVSMVEKCMLSSAELSTLDTLNSTTAAEAISQMGNLRVSRLIVTDHTGYVVYDSLYNDPITGKYVFYPEIIKSLEGNKVFTCRYKNGVMYSHAATPISSYGVLSGCVYITEEDSSQGALIQSLQGNIFMITFILEIVVIIFALVYASSFSGRLSKIMNSIKVIRKGDYSQKVQVGGHDELTVLGDEFNDLTAKLEVSEAKRRQFVSDASHELKTPLASIKLLTDSILQNDMDMQTIREFVGDIGDEAERLNRTSQKLLSLSRIDSQADGDCEIVYMAPTIQKVARMLKAVADKSGIHIEVDIQEDCTVLTLEDDLYQIVFNLMENAIKYNSPDGTVRVSLHREEDNAILQVSDTGIGIPEESLSHLFERFYRVDKARARKTGGSGLGLSIVRNLAERNHAEITVASTVGKGTTFTVTFPIFSTEEDSE